MSTLEMVGYMMAPGSPLWSSPSTWPNSWMSTRLSAYDFAPVAVERSGPRYELTGQLMEDLLGGLMYCGCYPGTKQLALLGLRAVHCRAVEELNPQVLLQTTAILESVDE